MLLADRSSERLWAYLSAILALALSMIPPA
jgi:hypothetical protein